jgi:hypothetical protein
MQSKLLKILFSIQEGKNQEENIELLETFLKGQHSSEFTIEELSAIPFDLFFTLINENPNKLLTERLYSIIKFIFARISVQDTAKICSYGSVLSLSLCHNHYEIRFLALEQFTRFINSNEIIFTEQGFTKPEMQVSMFLHEALELIRDEEEIVVSGAKRLFKSAILSFQYKEIFNDSFMKEIKSWMTKSDVTRFRIYDVITSFEAESHDLLDFCENINFINFSLLDLSSEDPLIVANALETFSKSSSYPTFFKALKQNFIFLRVDKIMRDTSSPLASFCIPFTLRFWGNLSKLAQRNEEVIEIFSKLDLLSAFLAHLQLDESYKLAAMRALLPISCSPLAIQILQNPDLTNQIFQFIYSGSTELQSTCLHVITALFSNRKEECNEIFLIPILRIFFSNEKIVKQLCVLGHSLYEETRFAVIECFDVFSYYEFSAKELLKNQDFINYILDRSTEAKASALKKKYEVVLNLIKFCDGNRFQEVLEELINYKNE